MAGRGVGGVIAEFRAWRIARQLRELRVLFAKTLADLPHSNNLDHQHIQTLFELPRNEGWAGLQMMSGRLVLQTPDLVPGERVPNYWPPTTLERCEQEKPDRREIMEFLLYRFLLRPVKRIFRFLRRG